MAKVVRRPNVNHGNTQVVKVQSKPIKRRRSKAKHLDSGFLIIIFALLTYGFIMVFSAGHAEALNKYGDSLYYIKRHSAYMMIGITIMLFLSSIDYHIYRRLVYYIMGIATLFLVLVLIPFIGSTQGTFARRWIGIGEFTFQPSEIMKFALIAFFAHLVTVNFKRMHTFKYGVVPFAGTLAVICVLMYLQPHMSGMIIICCIGAIMMFVGGTPIKYFIGLGLVAVVLAGTVLTIIVQTQGSVYVLERINMWLDPFADPTNSGWQTTNSLIAIGSGGLMGRGIGMSRQKYMYIPHPHNDFIFAIICEELGLLGAFIVIFLFIAFTLRGFTIATKAPDKFGYMMGVGLVVQITLQAALNIGVVTNTFPNTGISLPFFSYGGTALIMQLAQMGILLNISRHSVITKAL